MPELVRLYIRQVAIGFGLSAVFVALLLWLDIGGLGRLILASDVGYVAVAMLVVFNGIVFAGVQFAISVMRMQEPETPPDSGTREAAVLVPVPVQDQRRPRA